MSSHSTPRTPDHHRDTGERVRWTAQSRPVGPILPWRVRCVATGATISRHARRYEADLYAAARRAVEPGRYEVTG